MVQQYLNPCLHLPLIVSSSPPPRYAIRLSPPKRNVIVYFTSNHRSLVLVFCAWRITSIHHNAQEDSRDHPSSRYRSYMDTGKGKKCCYAMPAPNGSIRAIIRVFLSGRSRCRREKENAHRWVSTRSSNFGADKSVTVPARASRITAKRDMIYG